MFNPSSSGLFEIFTAFPHNVPRVIEVQAGGNFRLFGSYPMAYLILLKKAKIKARMILLCSR
jgi:hypothetical protein